MLRRELPKLPSVIVLTRRWGIITSGACVAYKGWMWKPLTWHLFGWHGWTRWRLAFRGVRDPVADGREVKRMNLPYVLMMGEGYVHPRTIRQYVWHAPTSMLREELAVRERRERERQEAI